MPTGPVLQVAGRRRPRGGREAADEALAERIRAAHENSDCAYGAPRVTAGLRDTHKTTFNRKRVARVTRKLAIVGIHLRKRFLTTERQRKQQRGRSKTAPPLRPLLSLNSGCRSR